MDANTWQPAKSDKSERLLQLTCALIFAERGLTKAELFASIPAYLEAQRAGTSEESLNRMFERDKSDLRTTGIQIFTPSIMDEPDDIPYRIADDTFVWPQSTTLNSKQLQLLTLAAQVWSKASLQSDATQALVRLRALGIEAAATDLIGYAPRIRTHEPSFPALTAAIDQMIEVSFSYRKVDGSVSKRRVQPWSLNNIDGQWMLQCFDLDAGEVRNFLLKRIISRVETVLSRGEPIYFPEPSKDDIDAANRSLQDHVSGQVCELRIKRDTSAWFHFHLDEEPAHADSTISFNYLDLELLAEELREFAAEIEILKPKQLAVIIRNGFEKVIADHA